MPRQITYVMWYTQEEYDEVTSLVILPEHTVITLPNTDLPDKVSIMCVVL